MKRLIDWLRRNPRGEPRKQEDRWLSAYRSGVIARANAHLATNEFNLPRAAQCYRESASAFKAAAVRACQEGEMKPNAEGAAAFAAAVQHESAAQLAERRLDIPRAARKYRRAALAFSEAADAYAYQVRKEAGQ